MDKPSLLPEEFSLSVSPSQGNYAFHSKIYESSQSSNYNNYIYNKAWILLCTDSHLFKLNMDGNNTVEWTKDLKELQNCEEDEHTIDGFVITFQNPIAKVSKGFIFILIA